MAAQVLARPEMSQSSGSEHSHVSRRALIVVLLSILSMALWAPDVKRAFGHPLGMADKVTLSAIDLADSPLVMRLRLLRNGGCWTAEAGEPCDLAVRTPHGVKHLVAPSPAEPKVDGPIVLARVALALLWLGCAATFLLLRPSPATWMFFVLSLYGWTPNNVVTEVGPLWLQTAMTIFENLWETCIPLAAPLFALYLFQPDHIPAWRRTATATAYIAITAIGLSVIAVSLLAVLAGSTDAIGAYRQITNGVAVAAGISSVFCLALAYYQSDRVARQRVRWVMFGFVAGYLCLVAALYTVRYSYVLYSAGQALYVFFITSATGYAVLRHRIIDVNVVVSRTLVYTLLSAFVVGIFALVDLFFSRALSESKAGLMADVGLALVLGFFMNSMHGSVDRFVDGILFRRKHLAEEHVALAADALRQLKTGDAVDRMLLEEPVRSFDLFFAALTRFDGDRLQVVLSHGAPIPRGTVVENAERLASYLATHRKALALRPHYWHSDALCGAGVEPLIAVPIFSHEDLTAVAFYTAHRNGTDLDGDEIALIERMADASGAAYDRLEARTLRQQLLRTGAPTLAPGS